MIPNDTRHYINFLLNFTFQPREYIYTGIPVNIVDDVYKIYKHLIWRDETCQLLVLDYP